LSWHCIPRSGIELCRKQILDCGAELRACDLLLRDLAVAHERGLNSHRPGVSTRAASAPDVAAFIVGSEANTL
jgi:hypothetical protein